MNDKPSKPLNVPLRTLERNTPDWSELGSDTAFSDLAMAQFSVEVAADEVFWMDHTSRIVYVNQTACDRLGYKRHELIGKRVWEWDPLFPEEVWPTFWRELKSRQHMTFETLHTTRLGDTFPVEIDGHFLQHGNKEYLFAFVQDISERKRQQRDREKQEQKLQAEVNKRTAQLQLEKKLAERALRSAQQAQEEAQLSASAKTQFLSNVSHEIRTPLNGIVGLLNNLMRDPNLQDAQRQQVDSIKECTDALQAVVSGILDLAKIETGRLTINVKPFELRELLDSLLGATRGAAEKKGLQLRCDEQLQNTHYVGDGGRILQILMNLVNNGIKFTRHGGIRVTARSLASHIDGDQLFFEVEDSGMGIEPEIQKTLFERFNQGDNSDSREHGGAGLGLSISKELVTLMGGEMGVSSSVGQGSRFWFSLRLPRATPNVLQTHQKASDSLQKATFSKARALLVDDNAINQMVALVGLNDAGINMVDAASNGEEALHLLEQTDYDVVFMDCQMPVMDGYEATRRIRQRARFKNLPIIALTANALADAGQRCKDAGMDDLIIKPFEQEQLLLKLNTHIPHLRDGSSLQVLKENTFPTRD